MDDTEEKPTGYVDDDLEEARRHWEGVHGDEVAQYRVMFGGGSTKKEVDTGCLLLPGLVVTAVTLAAIYGLYRLLLVLF